MKHQRPTPILLALLLAALTACGTPAASTSTPTPPLRQPTVAVTPMISASPAAASTPSPSAAPSVVRVPEATIPTTTALLPAVDPLPAPDLQFDGGRALKHVERQMQWVPRHTGTPGSKRNGDYIIEQLRAAGWQTEEQRFAYNGVEVRNIIAKRGSGPLLILGAHYDTRIYADEDLDPARQRDPVPGANDGASGVAVLLELAQHIDTEQLGREVWLTFFDAEDNGRIDTWEWIVGSTHVANNLPRQPEAMVLVDMIGDRELQVYYEENSDAELRTSIWQTAAELGYPQFIPQPKHSLLDDHTPFLRQGIPAVDLIDFDYPYWHTVADTTDKVSAESLEAIGRTLERWLETRQKAGG
jgi:hypothetical protein